eukprot:96605-Rhodomonas_salina.1
MSYKVAATAAGAVCAAVDRYCLPSLPMAPLPTVRYWHRACHGMFWYCGLRGAGTAWYAMAGTATQRATACPVQTTACPVLSQRPLPRYGMCGADGPGLYGGTRVLGGHCLNAFVAARPPGTDRADMSH